MHQQCHLLAAFANTWRPTRTNFSLSLTPRTVIARIAPVQAVILRQQQFLQLTWRDFIDLFATIYNAYKLTNSTYKGLLIEAQSHPPGAIDCSMDAIELLMATLSGRLLKAGGACSQGWH